MDEDFKKNFYQHVAANEKEWTDEESAWNEDQIRIIRQEEIEVNPHIYVQAAKLGLLGVVREYFGRVQIDEKVEFDGEDYFTVPIYEDKNKLGAEALIEAYEEGHVEVVKFLLENMTSYNYVLEEASFHGNLGLVKYAIESGADISFNNNYALTVSSGRGFLEIVKHLVEKGADIHADNDLALRSASKNSHFQICDYLVCQGCDPQKVVDDTSKGAEINKQWAIDFVKARDMNNKLDNELAKKPTKAQKLSEDIENEDFAYKTPTTKTSRTKL